MADKGEQANGNDTVTEQAQEERTDDEAVFPDLKLGEAWGESITAKRADELEGWCKQWEGEADHGERAGPFEGIALTGADVFWIAARMLAGASDRLAVARAARRLVENPSQLFTFGPNSLTTPNLARADLLRANLSGAILVGANLSDAHLNEANLSGASLPDANLSGADMYGVDLSGANLRRVKASEAGLDSANLSHAHLDFANLSDSSLFAANLWDADLGISTLSGANLSNTNLSGASLAGANLSATDLRGARLSVETDLSRATLTVTTQLADVTWNDAPLAQIAWGKLPVVGDETFARQERDGEGKRRDARTRGAQFEVAVRAYRLLAVALRSQGLNEHADRYAYRAQECQRHAFRYQRRWGSWLFQSMLGGLSGYGFRLVNILGAYGGVLAFFTVVYWVLGVHGFQHEPGWQAMWDSFLVSLSAIHGRATFEQLGAWSPAAWVAAIESVVGIVIEGVFVAVLVQRFFGGR